MNFVMHHRFFQIHLQDSCQTCHLHWSIKMENFNEGGKLYPNLNNRVYRVARKPAETPVKLPVLGNPGLKLGIKEGDYSDVFYRVG